MRETEQRGNGAIRDVRSERADRRESRVRTEQSEFRETPTGSDGRGHLQDSDGSKTLKTILAVLGSSRRRTTRRILSRTLEPGLGWPR